MEKKEGIDIPILKILSSIAVLLAIYFTYQTTRQTLITNQILGFNSAIQLWILAVLIGILDHMKETNKKA